MANNELDSIFNEGPENFLEEKLRAYVEHFNPDLKNKKEEPKTEAIPLVDEVEHSQAEPIDEAEEDDTEFQGADAWKKDAIKYCREVRWGGLDDFEAVWGINIPPEYLAFQNAIEGAGTWSTFNELRLSEGAFINPAEDKNLFEMIVLLDQLSYLGTSLPQRPFIRCGKRLCSMSLTWKTFF